MAYHDEPTREIPAPVHRTPGQPLPPETVAWQPPRRWEAPTPNRPPWHERDSFLVPLGLTVFATMIAVVAGVAWALWPDSSETTTATATDVQTLSADESTPTVLPKLEAPVDEPATGSISSTSGRQAAPVAAAPTTTTAPSTSPTTAAPTTAAPTTAQPTTVLTTTTAAPTTAVPTTPAPTTAPSTTANTTTTSLQCDPNYSGCVPVASDVDCAGGQGDGPAYLSGTAEVIGTDIYGLDRDDNGVACD